MNRREVIKNIGIGSAVLGVAGLSACSSEGSAEKTTEKSPNPKKRVMRIAHVTDVHVQPERNAPKGFEKCLHHIQDLVDPVDVIFNGGDSIMDALKQDRQRVEAQWDLWHKIVKSECSLPIEHCIGNHDVWGGGKTSDPIYGKKYAMAEMELQSPYRSFDRNGWHFIVLDSTHQKPNEEWYTAKLDETQFEWLKEDLNKTPKNTPILVFSHIPIMCAAAFFDGQNEKSGNWEIPGAWVHIDARRIVELFYEYPNVKTCISGHIHLVDEVVYNNVSYLCNGAVCGAWWKGVYHQTDAGYAVINLYDDGSFDREYVSYGWKV